MPARTSRNRNTGREPRRIIFQLRQQLHGQTNPFCFGFSAWHQTPLCCCSAKDAGRCLGDSSAFRVSASGAVLYRWAASAFLRGGELKSAWSTRSSSSAETARKAVVLRVNVRWGEPLCL